MLPDDLVLYVERNNFFESVNFKFLLCLFATSFVPAEFDLFKTHKSALFEVCPETHDRDFNKVQSRDDGKSSQMFSLTVDPKMKTCPQNPLSNCAT